MNCIDIVFVKSNTVVCRLSKYIYSRGNPEIVIFFLQFVMLANVSWLAKYRPLLYETAVPLPQVRAMGSVGDRIRIESDPHHFAGSESAFRLADPDTADPDSASKQCRSITLASGRNWTLHTVATFRHNLYRARIFKRLWSPGIDFKEFIPSAYVAWRAGTITLFLLP